MVLNVSMKAGCIRAAVSISVCVVMLYLFLNSNSLVSSLPTSPITHQISHNFTVQTDKKKFTTFELVHWPSIEISEIRDYYCLF